MLQRSDSGPDKAKERVPDKGKERVPDTGKERVPGSTSNFSRIKPMDFVRAGQSERAGQSDKMKLTPLSPTLTIGLPEGLPSSQALETNEPQIASFRIDSPARALLQEINASNNKIHRETGQRLTRITGETDFLEKHPQHTEVVKMRNAIARKMQASQRGDLLNFYSAHKDLSAAEAALAQEARMMRSLENGLKGLEYMENRLSDNDHTFSDDTVRKNINELTENLSQIQEKQNNTITQWEEIKNNIEQCVVKLKQHAPDLPLPELDKVLIFPKGKPKEKDEQSDKTEKETKKNENSTSASSKQGDQPSTSGDHAESAAKTTTSQTLELSEDAKTLHKELEGLLLRAQLFHGELTSLNNQWDNFTEKRKSQMDQLKASQDLQSQRVSEAMNAMTAGADKGKSDIATAMKYTNRLIALAAVAYGGAGLRLRM